MIRMYSDVRTSSMRVRCTISIDALLLLCGSSGNVSISHAAAANVRLTTTLEWEQLPSEREKTNLQLQKGIYSREQVPTVTRQGCELL